MDWVRLGDIADIKAGGTPSRSNKEYWDNGKIPWAKISDFNGKFLDKTEEFINENGLENSSAKLFKAGTILYSIFATIGEATILSIDSSTNQAIAGVDVNEDLALKEYVYYYLLSIKDEVIAKSRGVAQNNINLSILRNFEILLPDKKTQKSIVECLSVAEKLIKIRQDQIQALDDLLESSFYQMFGDIISTKYDVLKIDEIAKSTQYGTSKKADDKTGNYPILRMGNITYNGLLDLNDLKYIDISDDEKDKYLVKNGDILFNRTNSKELVGKTAIYNLDQEMAYAGYLIRLRVNEKINPIFLSRQMNMSFFKKTLFIKAKASINMSNINSKELREFKIICPPIEKQNKFADLVTKIEGQKGILEDSLSELSDLFASLMQDAFDGSLGK
uniref:restriction endonuclease subunit S n=1 Tax=Anaerococcus mediterraneensis TaxID=1870984 RepID=UPI000930695D|nr:restriction endonuclease subunit S [Anaerococcus mediterraneensis]